MVTPFNKQATKWFCVGLVFQGLMFVGFFVCIYYYQEMIEPRTSLWRVPSHIGLALFLWSWYILYLKRQSLKKLMTGGIFKYKIGRANV